MNHSKTYNQVVTAAILFALSSMKNPTSTKRFMDSYSQSIIHIGTLNLVLFLYHTRTDHEETLRSVRFADFSVTSFQTPDL